MSDDKDAEIDPRFDPAFQRGFDQSIPIEEYVPRPPSRKSPAEPSVTIGASPVPSAPPVPRALVPESPPGATDAQPAESVEAEPPAVTELDSSPSRNPFLLLLGIIAIALVAAGIWLFVRSGDAFNSRDVRSQGDYMSLAATIQMAPFIALLGAATAIGILFVFASKWRRRR